ncbi:hypothetical protein [Stenotrophomonas sp.]|uniref:hypothetical protein n=1 Tax=Stenotrophomonas sp. TaxID=69392 RepID=UPI0028ABDDF4|nr:hypothetical protein [Stenotrophomonas sp.]
MLGTYVRMMAGAFLLLAVGAVSPAQAESSSGPGVHHLSLRVMDEGREVMAPSVQMTAEGPVQLSIGTEQDAYTLELDILERSDAMSADAAAMQVVLWRGAVGSGSRLLDRVILLTPNGDAGSTGQQTTGASVELISHALEWPSADHLGLSRSCEGENSANPASMPGVANHTCCGRLCSSDSGDAGQTLTCCGNKPTKCCGCGVCCTNP